MSTSTKKILAESRRLAGLSPLFESAAAKDPARVASKEYQAPPPADKEGGEISAGGGAKSAEVGGSKTGPGMTDMTVKAPPADKDGTEVTAGGGAKSAEVGGAKSGPDGAVAHTGKAKPTDKEGGYTDAGGDSKVAKAGGAVPGDANIEDDGLRAEDVEIQYREARNARMYELVSMFPE